MNKATAALAAAALLLAFASPSFAGEKLADMHVKSGLKCESCHGPDMKDPKIPDTAVCTGCHAVDALAEKTKDVKPANPHNSPHYGKELDCANCHLLHQESENYCDQCHQFGFKVP